MATTNPKYYYTTTTSTIGWAISDTFAKQVEPAPVVRTWETAKTLLGDRQSFRIRATVNPGSSGQTDYYLDIPHPIRCLFDFANAVEALYATIFDKQPNRRLINYGYFYSVEVCSSDGFGLFRIGPAALTTMLNPLRVTFNTMDEEADVASDAVGKVPPLVRISNLCAAGLPLSLNNGDVNVPVPKSAGLGAGTFTKWEMANRITRPPATAMVEVVRGEPVTFLNMTE